jgi:hypothetical protein
VNFAQKLSVLVLAAAAGQTSAAILLSEDFESLPLSPYVSPTESGGDGTDWTNIPPVGWTRDQTTTPVGSPIEFYGWTFHDRQSWINTEGDQERSAWTTGVGTVMVADPDAYDDGTNVDESLYNVNILTPAINLAGLVANSVLISFDSSFRSEPPEIATLDVTFDGGATFSNLLTYDGNILPDAALFNDSIILPVNNPSSGTMLFRFSMNNASNDWWWAIDNLEIGGDVIPEPSTTLLALGASAALCRSRRRSRASRLLITRQ